MSVFRGWVIAFSLAACAAPALAARVPTLFIAGDSTASSYTPNAKNQQGWAAVLQPLFDPRKLAVVDLARGGRSSRTFITEGHWDRLLAQLRARDFVVIQVGAKHARALQEKPPGAPRPPPARGAHPGKGAPATPKNNPDNRQ